MTVLYSILALWGFIGYFVGALTRKNKPTTRKEALWQTFYLGPVVWLGVLLFGLYFLLKGE